MNGIICSAFYITCGTFHIIGTAFLINAVPPFLYVVNLSVLAVPLSFYADVQFYYRLYFSNHMQCFRLYIFIFFSFFLFPHCSIKFRDSKNAFFKHSDYRDMKAEVCEVPCSRLCPYYAPLKLTDARMTPLSVNLVEC